MQDRVAAEAASVLFDFEIVLPLAGRKRGCMGLLQLEIAILLLAALAVGFALAWMFVRGRWISIPSRLGVLICIVCFPILCWSCIDGDSRMISSKLQQSVSAHVNTAPMSGIDVTADGREITLTGKAPTDAVKAKAGDEALAVTGVRTVTNNLAVVGDASLINAQISKILSTEKVEFQPGNEVLLPGSIPVLQHVLAELKKGPGLSIRVEGHTDDTGSAAENRVLSERRAQAVVGWFAKNGIQSGRMQAAGFGSERPIAPNTTPEGKAKNRRVEITTASDTN